ncbi:MAG: hypothetical protein NTW96_17320 [Planctomycetia bacterium]|nr:hypothetical protein [Planctomycetia bacterium]
MTCGKWFTALGLVMLMAVSASAAWPPVSSTGMVLYYSFDGMTTGMHGVADGSLNNADGTIDKNVTLDFGLRGGAAKFGPRVQNFWDPTGWVDPVVPYQLQNPALPYVYNPWPNKNTTQDGKGRYIDNWDYNYIWIHPTDFGTVATPTSAQTVALWVKAVDTAQDMATWAPCGIYPGPDGDYNTTIDNVTRLWTDHLQIQAGDAGDPANGIPPDRIRTTLRDRPTNANIINQNPTEPSFTPYFNTWTHIAWTFDRYADTLIWVPDPIDPQQGEWVPGIGPEVKFYLNGALKQTWTSPKVVDLSLNGQYEWGARIGSNVDDARQFEGSMDEFYLFNRALTGTEIATLAASATPETPLLGDANLDRVVDDKDASILGKNWQVATGATWFMGDFNTDGAVNEPWPRCSSGDVAAECYRRAHGRRLGSPTKLETTTGRPAGRPVLFWPAPSPGCHVRARLGHVLRVEKRTDAVAVRFGGTQPRRGNGASPLFLA